MSVTDNFTNPSGLLPLVRLVLRKIAESLNRRVLLFQGCNRVWKALFIDTFGRNVRCAACLQDNLVDVGPILERLELIGLGEGELLREFNFLSFVVLHEKTLGNDCSGVEDSGKSSTQQVALFAVKSRICVNIGVQVARENVLD